MLEMKKFSTIQALHAQTFQQCFGRLIAFYVENSDFSFCEQVFLFLILCFHAKYKISKINIDFLMQYDIINIKK